MTGKTPSQNRELRKKLQKREQRILERLQEAQRAQAKALERFHRAETRLQKCVDRVQRVEGRLTLVRQAFDELYTSPLTPTAEPEIPAWAQSITPSTPGEILETTDTTHQISTPTSITEPDNLIKEAHAAAEAAEENARLAAARAAEINETTATIEIETVVEHPQSALEEAAEIAEIEVEEELVEAITAITIAEITAERAAAAEALAEASSAHTREARRRSQLAEQALGKVRVAIRSSLLTGAEAENALKEAEREVTHAQASLADAEAVEEQALTAAMNAEAEAEVAEGMAFAAVDRTAPLTGVEQEQDNLEEAVWEISQSYYSQEAIENESDITLKIPYMRPQDTE